MKKYLMTGIAALALCVGFTSCSHDVEQLSQEELNQVEVLKVKANYEQAFIKTFGQPASNQDWGFGSSVTRGLTRANEGSVIKPDMTNFPGYSTDRCNRSNYRSPEGYADIVAPVTPDEATWVQNWFSNNPGLTPQGQPFKNFFVQHVSTNGHTKAGYFHSTEGGKTDVPEARSYNDIYMDKLQIGATATEADSQHTLDFNATNGFNDWNLIYYENSSALQFGYHESYGSSYEWHFKCVELEVPGECFADGVARKGWYVGLSYYCDKKETNEKWHVIGGDRLQYGDDWILKIVPNDPVETADLRIIAEDLSVGEVDDDFDFNDVVIDVYYGAKGQAKAKILAAGGTLELKVDGKEVHTEFSKANENIDCAGKMINTNGTLSADANVRSKSLDGLIAPEITLTEAVTTPAQARDNIKIEVFKNNQWIELDAVMGKVASKVRVGTDYTWKNEREYVGDGFKNFVANKVGYSDWYKQQ